MAPATPPLPSVAPPAFTDAQRAARLRTMQRWATGLLIAMALLFLALTAYEAAHPRVGSWLGYLRAFAEASLVGALADWFAVTALFRRPLGLPIPHTAIIPEKKENIANNIGRFVQNNFLSEDVLTKKLETLDLASRAEAWLVVPENIDTLATRIAAAIPDALNAIDDAQLQAWLEEFAVTEASKLPVAPVAAELLSALLDSGKHHELIDESLSLAARVFTENKRSLRERVKKESPWYMPGFVEQSVYDNIVKRTTAAIQEIQRDARHPIRQKIEESLEEVVEKLRTSPEMQTRVEQAKTEVLNHPTVRGYLQRAWPDLKQALLADLQKDESDVRNRIHGALHSLAQSLLSDAQVRERLNQWSRRTLLDIALSQRETVGVLITDTVRQWDKHTLVQRLESQVGRDLQFIRINGTLVGGAVGLLLHLLRQLWLG